MHVVCVQGEPVGVYDALGSAAYVSHWLDQQGFRSEVYDVPRNPDTSEVGTLLNKQGLYPAYDPRDQ